MARWRSIEGTPLEAGPVADTGSPSTPTMTIENTADATVVTASVVTSLAFNVPGAVTGLSGCTASGILDDLV